VHDVGDLQLLLLVADVARPECFGYVPLELGTPPEDDAKLVHWTNVFTAFEDPKVREQWDDTAAVFTEIVAYCNAQIEQRREAPRDDLISALWKKGPTVYADWNERDVLSTMWSSLDNETKPLLRGLLYTLCRDPELQARLRRDPSLVVGFVEEGLRFLTPFRTIRRQVKQDVEIGGQKMKAGDNIYLITPLANRDPGRWECPHAFDAERKEDATHFAFSFGPGYCVGRYVGRAEAQEVMMAMLDETSLISLDPAYPNPEWAGEMYHSIMPVHAILR